MWTTFPDYGFRRAMRMVGMIEKHADSHALQRNLLRQLDNALWFEQVRFKLRVSTATAVGKRLFPERYAPETSDQEGRKDKRIERYASGASAAAREYRDAARHQGAPPLPPVLRDALDVSIPLGNGRAQALLERTCPTIQKTVLSSPRKNRGFLVRRRTEIAEHLLNRYACTDSVAALVVLLREAAENGLEELSLQLGHTLYYVTLLWFMKVPFRYARRELAVYFIRHIFPLARTQTLALHVDFVDYMKCMECLNHYVHQLNRFPRPMRMSLFDDLFHEWDLIWNGGFGLSYLWGLAPGLVLRNAEAATPKDSRMVTFRLVSKTWGWRVLRLMEREDVPPASVVELFEKELSSLTRADLDGLETEEEIGDLRWMQSPLRARMETERAGQVAQAFPVMLGA